MKDELEELRGEFIRNLQKISCSKDDPWMRYGIAMCATILNNLRTEVKDIVDKAMKDLKSEARDARPLPLPPDPKVSLVADSGLKKATIDWLIAHGAASFEDITQCSYFVENDERKNYICINGKWIRYPFAIFRLSQEMNKVGRVLPYVDKTHIWDKCPKDVAEKERCLCP